MGRGDTREGGKEMREERQDMVFDAFDRFVETVALLTEGGGEKRGKKAVSSPLLLVSLFL